MSDFYSKEQRSAYNKRYRAAHLVHLRWMQTLYRAKRKAKKK